MGIVGLVLLVATLLYQTQLAIIHQRTFPLYVVIYLSLYGITETSFFDSLPNGNFILWSVAIAVTLPSNKETEDEAEDEEAPAGSKKSVPT